MRRGMKTGLALAVAVLFVGGTAMSQQDEHRQDQHAPPAHAPAARPPAHGEPHAGPQGYQRPAAPEHWNTRPATVDRGAYQHNFQAARAYHIGPYHRPAGWAAHRWAYGQVLPRAYWGANYLLGDYWLFGLEVPPVGFEWVRDDDDAILVNTANGQILQVEYGVFD